jgi:dienelactone hydrolase
MQNEPKFPSFSPKNEDYAKKRTQTNPISSVISGYKTYLFQSTPPETIIYCSLRTALADRINLLISTFFGGLKMSFCNTIQEELTTKLKSSKVHHTRIITIIIFLIINWLYANPVKASFYPNSDSIKPLNRFPRMVQEYFVKNVRRIEQQANKRREALKTRDDAENYVNDIREKIQQSFGLWPEKTPLNPRITGTLERDQYKIEKIIFESRPGFLVTANLYIPKGRRFPLPGVVGTCGHSSNGKAAEAYQSFAQGLARQGYVVLIYDPLGQGERLQYPDKNLKSKVGVGVREHLYAGNQQFLVGEFIGSWRAWDGIRALDYLLTRKEVDPKKIGVTGNSGGGTMTTWLCGVESRWTMGAPSCFVTTFRRNTENELPADTEQCPPKALALGLDHSDFLAAMAPKPVIILAKEKDYFDARGAEEAYNRLKSLYSLLGAEKNIDLFIGPGYHGYSRENREAMYHLFNRTTGISDAQTEPELIIEKDETLYCTPRGQVCELDSRPVYSYTKDISQALVKKRRKNLSASGLKRRIVRTLRLRNWNDQDTPEYRILRNWRSRQYPKRYWTTYTVETEPGILAVVYRLSDERLMSRPPKGQKRAILYVSHQSSDAELRNEPLIKEMLKTEPDSAFYTCDVRGLGESQPETCNENSFLNVYGCDYFYAIHSIMLDKPYTGQRTYDLLRVIDWLKSNGHDEVHLVAKGWGAIPATFTAVLSDNVKQVTLKNALTSYTDIAESQTYSWPLSSLVPDILKSFDLPDCYRILRNKKLKQIDPWGPDGEKGQ